MHPVLCTGYFPDDTGSKHGKTTVNIGGYVMIYDIKEFKTLDATSPHPIIA